MLDEAPNERRSAEDAGRTPDAELLRQYEEEKSDAAFAALVARYVDLVYSAALRQLGGDTHRAHDVAQAVFTALARKAGALASHPVLAGWLYTSTHLAAIKVRRNEARRAERERAAQLMMRESSSDDATTIDWERLRPVLDEAMRGLRDRDREAVLLRYFARRPFAEIGTALDVSEDGARMRVDRALEKLRVLLARRGVTSTAAALGLALANQAVTAAPAGLAAQFAGSALAGGGATGGVLCFMSTTKFVSAAAAAVVLLSVGFTSYRLFQMAGAREALASAQRDRDERMGQQRALEARRLAAEKAAMQAGQGLAQASETAKAAEAPPAAPRPASGGTPDEIAAGNAFLAKFPAVRQALTERSYARIRARFQPLYAQLRLTPEASARFEEILLDAQGVSTSMPEIGQVLLRPGTGRTEAEINVALKELLGEEGFAAYRAQLSWSSAQQFALGLAEALYFTDTPLTGQQGRVVTQAMIDTGRRRTSPGAPRDWDEVFTRARTVLSEPQLAALDRMKVQEEFQMAIRGLSAH